MGGGGPGMPRNIYEEYACVAVDARMILGPGVQLLFRRGPLPVLDIALTVADQWGCLRPTS